MESPLDRFEVRVIEREDRAIAIFAPAIRAIPATLDVRRYPEGDRLEVLVGPDAERTWRELVPLPEEGGIAARFDFDGDDTADTLTMGTHYAPVVRIVSGRDGRVLFEDEDVLEYESRDRAIPLGDVDGDGCSELALLHPRMDRSDYDLELWDLLLGAKSWVTVVSSAPATR